MHRDNWRQVRFNDTNWRTGNTTGLLRYCLRMVVVVASDAAEGIVTARYGRIDQPEPINLGTGQEITIADLVQLIAELTGFQGTLEWDTSQPDGQPRRCLSTARARDRLGWQANTSLEAGLRETIAWWRGSGQANISATGAPA